eukprot:scaffold5226_cov103-Alexandrium_tamarense.AAC.1
MSDAPISHKSGFVCRCFAVADGKVNLSCPAIRCAVNALVMVLFAELSNPKGTRVEQASLCIRCVFRLDAGYGGMGGAARSPISVRSKSSFHFPHGSTTCGIRAWCESTMSPISWSGDIVWPVSLFVPPFTLINFPFSRLRSSLVVCSRGAYCSKSEGEGGEMTMTSKPTVDSAVPCLSLAAVTWFTSMNQSKGRERGAVFTTPFFSVSTASPELQYCAVT